MWRKSLTRRAVSPQSRSLFSASFQTFCLTAGAYLNRQKYGLFCSLLKWRVTYLFTLYQIALRVGNKKTCNLFCNIVAKRVAKQRCAFCDSHQIFLAPKQVVDHSRPQSPSFLGHVAGKRGSHWSVTN